MKKRLVLKKKIVIVLFLLVFQANTLPVMCAGAADTRIVIDRAGDQVCIPTDIKRILITCYGGASHEVAILGGADRIVGHPPMDRFPLLTRIYPQLATPPSVGSFNDINIEHVMMLEPDIVIASIISPQGNERIKKLGIPLVTVGTGRTSVSLLLKEFATIGQILDHQKEARDLINYWQAKLNLIRQRTADLTGIQRKTVYYCSSGAPMKTEGSIGWGQNFIEAAGGRNVSRSLQISGKVTSEQLLLWNPDVIIAGTQKIGVSGNRMEDILKLASLKAVEKRQTYYCPIGAFWWDRPSPEAILGILWLARHLYPSRMQDIDIHQEAKQFYRRFYHYDLTDSEYASFYYISDK